MVLRVLRYAFLFLFLAARMHSSQRISARLRTILAPVSRVRRMFLRRLRIARLRISAIG